MITTTMRLVGTVCAPILLAHLLLFGGNIVMNADVPGSPQIGVGQEFPIKVGQRIKLAGQDVQVRFVAVSEDSRCPTDVNCVWAGNAAVALDFIDGKCTTLLKLNTHQNSQSSENGKAGAYRVKLVKLEPYPRSTEKIAPGDYTATLVITKE